MSKFQKASCRNRKKRDRCPVRLIQLSAAGEVFRALCRDTACRVRRFRERNIPLETFHRNVFKIKKQQAGHKGGAVLFAPPSKSWRFSHPPSPRAGSMAQGVSLSADSDSEGYSPSKRVYFASRCMQIALSDFLRDERKSGRNPLWISEHFPEISRKRCKQGACE